MSSTEQQSSPEAPNLNCQEPDPPSESELRALYDIRIKEIHHYNTIVWAFPIAYATLLAVEIKIMDANPWILLCAGIFNLALCYTFTCHLRNRDCILVVLRKTEKDIKNRYGANYVPDFPDTRWKATTVMKMALWLIAIFFLMRALAQAFCHCRAWCHQP